MAKSSTFCGRLECARDIEFLQVSNGVIPRDETFSKTWCCPVYSTWMITFYSHRYVKFPSVYVFTFKRSKNLISSCSSRFFSTLLAFWVCNAIHDTMQSHRFAEFYQYVHFVLLWKNALFFAYLLKFHLISCWHNSRLRSNLDWVQSLKFVSFVLFA